MKNSRLVSVVIPSMIWLQSCFPFPEGYERSVNDYFWLYGTPSSSIICLGRVDKGYRFSDGYICAIQAIGWNNEFLICKTVDEMYYIQDLVNLDNKRPENYSDNLVGPIKEKDFKLKRDSIKVDEDLDFEITY